MKRGGRGPPLRGAPWGLFFAIAAVSWFIPRGARAIIIGGQRMDGHGPKVLTMPRVAAACLEGR